MKRSLTVFIRRWLHDQNVFLQLNDWLKEHPNYKIVHIDFQESRNTFHESLAVTYDIEEVNNEG